MSGSGRPVGIIVKCYHFLPFQDTNTSSNPIIVIVGDDQESLHVAETAVEAAGFRFQSFRDAAGALEFFAERSNDCPLVITDIRMAGMSGFRLARKLRSINPHTKIIFMTEFVVNRAEFERLFPSLNIDAFIKKPFDRKQLTEIVEQQLTVEMD